MALKSQFSKLRISLWLVLVQLGLLTEASAKLGDDDSTVAYLAAQCSVSSGHSADNYLMYAMSLAKTMGEISAADQEEIFGFVPSPSGAVAGGVEEELQQLISDLGSAGDEEGGDAGGGDDEGGGDEEGGSGSSFWDRIKEFFEMLFGG